MKLTIGIVALLLVSVLFYSFLKIDGRRRMRSEAFLSLPSLKLLKLDSATSVDIEKDSPSRPLLILYFSPDCEHCQEQTRRILNNLDGLKDVSIYFLSPSSINELRGFSDSFHINKYPGITIGRDYEYNFFNFFKIKGFPAIALYDAQHKLIRLFREEAEGGDIQYALRP